MRRMKILASLAMVMVLGSACLAQADDMSDAKARRKARLPEVEQLVQAGTLAEGDDGYLVATGELDAAKSALMKAENADRKIGYEAIAKANGKTVEEVGKQAGAINKARQAKK